MIFGISGNLEKKELPRVVERLISRFQAGNTKFVIHDTLARFVKPHLRSVKIERKMMVAEADLRTSCSMLISLGGDGTILRMARLLGGTTIPILGINLGKLGFLAEVSVEEMDDCLDDVLHHRYVIERRMMLQSSGNGMKGPYLALNDIVVSKYGASRVMSIETYVNKEYLATFTGDGIIISTPTGSTAYALANGGPIVTPTNHSITISPICPHTLTARPVIVPENSIINMKVLSTVARIQLTADGQQEKHLTSPATVTVSKAPFEAHLVRRRGTNFYEVLRTKLHWGKDVRVGNSREY
ncbi:MAG TPA: NAD(+)/NADH kinase [Bacteroidota bacterium]|nr:NAD(+)/NADH kinase [Bacteroidota bacterium]